MTKDDKYGRNQQRSTQFRPSTTSPGFYVGKTKLGHPPGFIKGYNFQNKTSELTDKIEPKKSENECEEFESFMDKFGNYSKCYLSENGFQKRRDEGERSTLKAVELSNEELEEYQQFMKFKRFQEFEK